jgi:hypothetical protein
LTVQPPAPDLAACRALSLALLASVPAVCWDFLSRYDGSFQKREGTVRLLAIILSLLIGFSTSAAGQVKTKPSTPAAAPTGQLNGTYVWASQWGAITIEVTGKDGDLLQGAIDGPGWRRTFDTAPSAGTVVAKVIPDGAIRIYMYPGDPRASYELRPNGRNLSGKYWYRDPTPHQAHFTRKQ